MLALFTGGRDYGTTIEQRAAVEAVVDTLPLDAIVLQGGAEGLDKRARLSATRRGFPVVTAHASWEAHGKAAGPIRNAAMLCLKPDVVYAFPGGRGTADMTRQAVAARVPVHMKDKP